jgi:hypothetical protein
MNTNSEDRFGTIRVYSWLVRPRNAATANTIRASNLAADVRGRNRMPGHVSFSWPQRNDLPLRLLLTSARVAHDVCQIVAKLSGKRIARAADLYGQRSVGVIGLDG